MKKEEIKLIVTISIGIAAFIGICYLVILQQTPDIKNGIRAISFGLSTTSLFWVFYFTWGWKWWLLRKIFYRPNLNGTWSGKLSSDWKDGGGKEIEDIDFFMVIRQNFIRIHITTFTKNYVGISYSETFSLNKDTGLKNLSYLYRKDTSTSNYDDKLQEGAAELRLIISREKKLVGKYWSNKKTNGELKVDFVSKNHVDSFDDAKNIS